MLLLWIWEIILCLSWMPPSMVHCRWTLQLCDAFVPLGYSLLTLVELNFALEVQHQVTSLPLQGRESVWFRAPAAGFCCCWRQCSLCGEHRDVGLEALSPSFFSFCHYYIVLNVSCPCGLLMNHSSKLSALHHLTVIINLNDANFDYW